MTEEKTWKRFEYRTAGYTHFLSSGGYTEKEAWESLQRLVNNPSDWVYVGEMETIYHDGKAYSRANHIMIVDVER